jgi:hypothetical protein
MLRELLTFLPGMVGIPPKPATGPLVEGGLYVMHGRDLGTFVPLKVLMLEGDAVHVRIFDNVFQKFPFRIEESALHTAGEGTRGWVSSRMGCMRISTRLLLSWEARFVQLSSATSAELEACRPRMERCTDVHDEPHVPAAQIASRLDAARAPESDRGGREPALRQSRC